MLAAQKILPYSIILEPTIMKRQISLFSMVALTIISTNLLSPTLATAQPRLMAQKAAAEITLLSGSFVQAEHPTQGMATIVQMGRHKYLKLDNSFKSEDGPDLFVILHRQDSPQQYQKKDYISLGRLKKIDGVQMYQIPSGVNIADFKSVVIWCRQFNATFGFAPIS
jgi:Electron transfer DM13